MTSPKLVKIHKSLARRARGRFPAGRREATRQMAGLETFLSIRVNFVGKTTRIIKTSCVSVCDALVII